MLFFPHPAYTEVALPDSGTPIDLQIDDTNNEASQSDLGEADAQVSNGSIPENIEAAETTDAAETALRRNQASRILFNSGCFLRTRPST